jgi:hypothetical protein
MKNQFSWNGGSARQLCKYGDTIAVAERPDSRNWSSKQLYSCYILTLANITCQTKQEDLHHRSQRPWWFAANTA